MTLSSTFFRITGYLVILGSLLAIVGHILKPQLPSSNSQLDIYLSQLILADSFLVIGVPLVIIGLIGIYLRHQVNLKWWGWLGYLFIALGLLFVDVIQPVWEMGVFPWALEGANTFEEFKRLTIDVSNQHPFDYFAPYFIMAVLGPILTAFAFWKAKVYSPWLALIMILFLPVFIIAPMLGIHQFPAYIYISLGLYAYYLSFEKIDKSHEASIE